MSDQANRGKPVTDVPDEEEFLEGAVKAVKEAVARLHRAGIATTHVIDGKFVRIHPDGRREEIRPKPAT